MELPDAKRVIEELITIGEWLYLDEEPDIGGFLVSLGEAKQHVLQSNL